MKLNLFVIGLLIFISLSAQTKDNFRPPSVPLITHDPYFSIWSPADRISDRETVHWTGSNHSLHNIIRIDGKSYRVIGGEPTYLEPLKQIDLAVYPTRTVYKFANKEIKLTLTFTTPLLLNDLDIYSRPVTYISWDINSADGKQHNVQLFFDSHSEIAVNTIEQKITWDSPAIEGLTTLRVGSSDQDILGKKGDNLRIDWGYLYVSTPNEFNAVAGVNAKEKLHKTFIENGNIPENIKFTEPRKSGDGYYSLGFTFDLGLVGSENVSRWLMTAYDDLYSIRYFDTDLKAWWKRGGKTIDQLLVQSAADYTSLRKQCEEFDNDLMRDLTNAGGDKYAQMCALVYRQCLAAHKLTADANDMPLIFSKENFSNGCIATVDVIYPASPFFILLSPALTKAMLQPLLDYSATPRWKFAFASHDMGTYPYATGQAYGGGETSEENQMPVEETGNMIIMLAALANVEGNADFAKTHWAVIEKWAEYLLLKGFDPENQLCTDDFAGHLAHNVNLSAKTIVAVACYAQLCDMLGMKDKSHEFRAKAENMVGEWIKQADDGHHTRLAFDQPGTWSQKYNLVWDKILELNLFPESIVQREIEYYKTKQAEFGLPLDNRERYTKNDWICWTASLAENINDFRTLFNPVYNFADKTPQRIPLSDWYITDNAFQRGFQARSVVGGFFIKMLRDKNLWAKWSGKGTNVSGNWAPLILK